MFEGIKEVDNAVGRAEHIEQRARIDTDAPSPCACRLRPRVEALSRQLLGSVTSSRWQPSSGQASSSYAAATAEQQALRSRQPSSSWEEPPVWSLPCTELDKVSGDAISHHRLHRRAHVAQAQQADHCVPCNGPVAPFVAQFLSESKTEQGMKPGYGRKDVG